MRRTARPRLTTKHRHGSGNPPRLFSWGVAILVAAAAGFVSGCDNRADASSGLAAARAPSSPGVVRAVSSPASARPTAPGGTHGTGADARPPSPTTGELRTLDSDAIQREMKSARGRTLIVHLWASWCGPCIEELPLIDRFARAARARGAVVLSISLDTDYLAIGRVPIVLRARAPNLTAIVARFDDPDRFISLFSKSWQGAIPALFVFDRAGKLEHSLIGESRRAELDALVSDLPAPAGHE